MKEDILEQLVTDYLEAQGYFTVADVKFKPDPKDRGYDSQQDCVHSDIDVLAFHPRKRGPRKVIAVSCKSWQHGFDAAREAQLIKDKRTVRGREAWRTYRELVSPKWAKALRRTIAERTGCESFTYFTAVTKLVGDRRHWEENPNFRRTLRAEIKIITLDEMAESVLAGLTTTVTNSELGRTLQVLKAAGVFKKP